MTHALATRPAPVMQLRAVREPDPPWDHDPEAERAVLAAVLLDAPEGPLRWNVWRRVSALLAAEDFFDPRHGEIWRAFERLAAAGVDIDVVHTANELRRMDRLNTIGGAQVLGQLTDEIATVVHCEAHARLVKEFAARRAVATLARGLAVRAHDLGRPIALTLAGVQAALAAVPLPSVEAPTMEAAVDGYFATLAGDRPPGPPPVPTAWADLDHALLGGLRAMVLLLVGLPGTGKTTLAFQWSARVARSVGPVLFIEYELDRDESTDALLATIGGVACAKVRAAREHPTRPVLNAEEMARLEAAGNALHGMALHLMDETTPGCPQTVAEIVALARSMRPAPAMIVIDNLGEMKTRGKGLDEGAATREKMGDLRHARKLLGIPIVVLAHPNREATKGAMMRRLRTSDIAGGSAAEKMCDGVLLVHREDMHPTRDHKREPPEAGVLEIYSSKVRGVGAMFCELVSVPSEHRYASRRRRDPGSARGPAEEEFAEPSFAGEGLPMDDAPVFQGETGRLALDSDDGTDGAPW